MCSALQFRLLNPSTESAGRLKLFELKTMCLLVTLSDRAEVLWSVPTAIDAQAGGAVMASRQVRITGRAVLDCGEWRVYARVAVVRRPGSIGTSGSTGEFSSKNLTTISSRKRSLAVTGLGRIFGLA